MDNDTLKRTAKEIFQAARDMKEDGKVPLTLGPKGMLALIHYKTTEEGSSTRESLLQIAVYALCAYAAEVDEGEYDDAFQKVDLEPPWEEEEEEFPKETCPHNSTTEIKGYVHCAHCGEPLYEASASVWSGNLPTLPPQE